MTWSKRSLRIVTVIAVLDLVCGTPGTARAVSTITPLVAPGSCGNVLLAGSAWLGGNGVAVNSNGPDQGEGTSCGGTNTVDGITTGSEWQCTELVNRLYVSRGWIHATWPGNGGRSSPAARDSMYDEAPSSLSKQPNGSVSYIGPGDAVSINVYDNGVFQADGHVLVVNSASDIASGTVPLVSQNGGDPTNAVVTSSATLSGSTLTIPSSGDWSYSVIGVVHAPAPPGTISGSPAVAPAGKRYIDLFTVASNGAVDSEHWDSGANAWSSVFRYPAGFRSSDTSGECDAQNPPTDR